MIDAPNQPELTVTQASKAARVDPRTIRRRLTGGDFPNAHRVNGRGGPDTGPWLIPVTDLLAAGLSLHTPEQPQASGATGVATDGSLQVALADAVRRAEVAEAVAAERERVIEAQRIALYALTGDPPLEAELGPDAERDPDVHPDGTFQPEDFPEAVDDTYEAADQLFESELYEDDEPPPPPGRPETGSPTGVERRADPWWTVPSPPTPIPPPRRHWWQRR
jgi:hypothetical protein